MRISQHLLEQGMYQYQASMGATNRRPRDPVITPFVMAMKIGGYTEVLVNRCAKLRACPICPVGKGNYSQLYEKNSSRVWACPHCQNVTDEENHS